MIYLNEFSFPSADTDHAFIMAEPRKCYDTFYPFQVLSSRGLRTVAFEPVTIFYGSNGSGKSTALNVIAEKAELPRDSAFNKSNFYPDYVARCAISMANQPADGRIITSDDVFDYMLNLRHINEGIDIKREEIFADYLDAKYSDFQMKSIADYERLKKVNRTRSKTQSRYTRAELIDNPREHSNGESAFKYFVEKIGENGLYILDEPENSLSPKRQRELAGLIAGSARFFGCQFIISTHSPFLLAIKSAKVYDLDANPARVRDWMELENIKIYMDFFNGVLPYKGRESQEKSTL